MSASIVVVGSLNHDIVTTLRRFPNAGETVIGTGLATFCGGKGANQAFAAGRLGAATAMIGQVGSDAAGDAQIGNLSSAGVQTESIVRHPVEPTGTAVIAVDESSQNRIIVIPGANGTFTPKVLEGAAGVLNTAKFVLLQLEVPMETVEAAARMARDAGAIVMLDPAPAAPLSKDLLRNVDYLTPNASELELLTGTNVPEDANADAIAAAARMLIEQGARKVIAKLGSRGAILVSADSVLKFSPYPVKAVDTTAAGDCFNAAFAAALAEGADEVHAGRFACAAAALSVTRAGAQASMPTRAEVEALLAQVI